MQPSDNKETQWNIIEEVVSPHEGTGNSLDSEEEQSEYEWGEI